MIEELNLKELFSNFVRFVIRNIALLLSIVGISCALVLLYYTSIRPAHYESVAICISHISDLEEKEEGQKPAVDLINHLQVFLENKDFNALGNVLGVEAEVANQFLKIEAEQVYFMNLNETHIDLERFTIRIVMRSEKFYNEVEDAFLYYFKSNKYLGDLSFNYFERRRRMYNDVVNEINALQEQRGLNNTGDFINTEVTSSEVINEIVSLCSLRERINKELSYKTLDYIQPFSKISKQKNDILVWTALSAVLSFIFGLFVAFTMEVKIK